jgi:hypothetical protein
LLLFPFCLFIFIFLLFFFTTCQRYEKGHLEIRKMEIKDAKYLIRF